ncbi:hypothetical protein [Streptomyces purpureus]|uniref:hypothetical protein n=1 Tax=Streptomyces purpureus TaxID=1951 RepID=UPI001670A302
MARGQTAWPGRPGRDVPPLFEPFRRLRERGRQAPGESAGLGPSIVSSIARAHTATTTAHPNPHGGGLTIRVEFSGRGIRGQHA